MNAVLARLGAAVGGVLLVPLGGCSTDPVEPPAARPDEAPSRGAPAVVSLGEARRLPADRMLRADLEDAGSAPSLADDPPGRAVLVATVNAFDPRPTGLPVGEPYVLGADGVWRTLPATVFGGGGRWGVETPFDLSGDGRRLAVLDEGTDRLVVVDLRDGSWRDVRLPTRDAVALDLDVGGAAVTFRDRDDPTGWRRLDLVTEAVATVTDPTVVRRQGTRRLVADGGVLTGTPREITWTGAAGGARDELVMADGLTGRIFRWSPGRGVLRLVGTLAGPALTVRVAADVLRRVAADSWSRRRSGAAPARAVAPMASNPVRASRAVAFAIFF